MVWRSKEGREMSIAKSVMHSFYRKANGKPERKRYQNLTTR